MKNTKWILGVIIFIFIGFLYGVLRQHINWLSNFSRISDSKKQEVINISQNPNLTKTPTKKLILKNKEINLLVAQTPDETMWGLSDFPSLPPDTGMMFMFPQPGIYSFWMKNMKFPLDMIWIDSDNRVVTIHENISPDTYYKNPPELFLPTSPASAVIELPGGFIKINNLKIGNKLNIL
jgi:uncharacterized membrane protein (UPF0127 family)